MISIYKRALMVLVLGFTFLNVGVSNIHAIDDTMLSVKLPNESMLDTLVRPTPIDLEGAKKAYKAEIIKKEKEAEARKRESELTIEERIYNACERYGVPYNIVLAIARLETGWFRSYAFIYRNNPGGSSAKEVPMTFNTIDDGVDYFVKNLANNYFAIGLDTPELIGPKYCPNNTEWIYIVKEMMEYE